MVRKFTGDPPSLHLGVAGDGVHQRLAKHTRRHPATILGCTQEVEIDAAATVHPQGFMLKIPCLTIFDVEMLGSGCQLYKPSGHWGPRQDMGCPSLEYCRSQDG